MGKQGLLFIWDPSRSKRKGSMCFERLIIDLLILPMLESLLGYRKDQISGPPHLGLQMKRETFSFSFLRHTRKSQP